MRMTYKIALGLLLVNAFLTFYSPIFNTSLSDNTISYEDEDIQEYNIFSIEGPGDVIALIFSPTNYEALAAASAVIAVAVLAAFATKNYVLIGVGLFVSFVIGLYVKLSATIMTIGATPDQFYSYDTYYLPVSVIITIVGIAIGVIVVFNVVDMFAPAPVR